jgi:hypothetical protein
MIKIKFKTLRLINILYKSKTNEFEIYCLVINNILIMLWTYSIRLA